MLFLPDTLSATYWLCLLNDKDSRSILGWVLAWYVSGVNNVIEDYGAEISKELSFRYAVISSR